MLRTAATPRPASSWLPQLFTNEIGFWAVCNAAIILAASRLTGSTAGPLLRQPLRALGIAAATFAIAYALVASVQFIFNPTSAIGSSPSSR